MLDDATLPSEEAQEYQRDIGLRINHIGLRVFLARRFGSIFYRLVCYFQTSEYLADLSDGGDFCPWQGTAVAVRFIGAGPHHYSTNSASKARPWPTNSAMGWMFRKLCTRKPASDNTPPPSTSSTTSCKIPIARKRRDATVFLAQRQIFFNYLESRVDALLEALRLTPW